MSFRVFLHKSNAATATAQKAVITSSKLRLARIPASSLRRLHQASTSEASILKYPYVKAIDNEVNKATIVIEISGDATQKAFSKSCDLFNEEIKNKGYKVPGFRVGSKLPPMYLYQIFGEEQVKSLCGTLLAKDIQDECDKAGILTVGRGKIADFKTSSFVPGKNHVLEVEVELWPTISYSGESGYKSLSVKVPKVDFDREKYEKVKGSILERYKVLEDTSPGHIAAVGDVVVANMRGFEKNADGSKGASLPDIAKGDKVEIVLEQGKFMEGFMEGLLGGKQGDTKDVSVKFPVRPSGPGAKLSGKEAIFEVVILGVKSKILPVWDNELANRIRDGMTLSELEAEVRGAVDTENGKASESARNDAIAKALLEIASFNKVPESLVDENTQVRFQNMLMDFKEQGSDEQQIKEMATPENFNKYKEISRGNVEKTVKLGLLFRDIAEKEKIEVSSAEITEQLDLLNAQAKQKGTEAPDADMAKDEIENTLLRLKVFDFLATKSTIEYVDAEPAAAPK